MFLIICGIVSCIIGFGSILFVTCMKSGGSKSKKTLRNKKKTEIEKEHDRRWKELAAANRSDNSRSEVVVESSMEIKLPSKMLNESIYKSAKHKQQRTWTSEDDDNHHNTGGTGNATGKSGESAENDRRFGLPVPRRKRSASCHTGIPLEAPEQLRPVVGSAETTVLRPTPVGNFGQIPRQQKQVMRRPLSCEDVREKVVVVGSAETLEPAKHHVTHMAKIDVIKDSEYATIRARH